MIDNPDLLLRQAAGVPFYNTSPLTFTKLLNDPKNVAEQPARLHRRLLPRRRARCWRSTGSTSRSPGWTRPGCSTRCSASSPTWTCTRRSVPNDAMGYIFEELLRRFSEMCNETAGEHFTPREVIRLMVNLLFAEDDDVLTGTAPVRTDLRPGLRHRRHADIADQVT